MKTRLVSLLVPTLIPVLAACGSGGGQGQPDPGDRDGSLSGTLLEEGTSRIHSLDLPAGVEWQQRLSSSSVYGAAAVHRPANELMLASLNMGAPLRIAVHDLENFALKRTFVWPNSGDSDYFRIHSLAVSPDGQHFAVFIEGIGPNFVEIINTGSMEVLFKGALPMAGYDLLWLDGDTIAFSAQLVETEWAGGIVGVPLENLADDSETIEFGILLPFIAAEWALGQPSDLSLSANSRQLAYSYNSDIWLKDLTNNEAARQLTTGPSTLVGPAFSPDATHLALVARKTPTRSDTFVLPLNQPEPLFVDGPNSDPAAVMLAVDTMVDSMLRWQP